MRDGRPMTTLREVLRHVKRSEPVLDGVHYPALGVLKEGKGVLVKEPFLGGSTSYKSLNRVLEGDVVLRTITAFESPVGVAEEEHDGGFVSGVFETFEITPCSTPAFLRLYLKLPAFWEEMRLRAHGSVLRRKTISRELFLDITLSLPPLPEQHRIVDLMGAVDAYVTAADARVEAARTARTALLTDLLSTPGEDWLETTLGDVVAISSGGTPRTTNPDYWGGDLPWISGSTLYSSLLTDSEKRITKRALDDGASVTPPRSILVLVRGMRLISEIRIGLAGRELAFSQDVKALIPKEGVHPTFLWLTLLSRSPELLAGVRRAGHGTGVLETSTLLATTLGIPSLQEQARIVAILEAAGDVADCCERVATNARKVRTAVLADLLSGAHEIPSGYDQFIQAA